MPLLLLLLTERGHYTDLISVSSVYAGVRGADSFLFSFTSLHIEKNILENWIKGSSATPEPYFSGKNRHLKLELHAVMQFLEGFRSLFCLRRV